MKGKYHVVVQNKRVHYELDIKRNITVIRGDSATGKTTLYDMIALAARQGESSGIEVQCEKKCRTLEELDWKLVLPALNDCIIFLDEDNLFLKTTDFARMVKDSDNYFVIITREDLVNLPYSVEEIYGIHTSGKYNDMKKVYNEFYHIYSSEEVSGQIKPEEVIVEDSNSGFEFFSRVCSEYNMKCQCAGGKSKIKNVLSAVKKENVLVIADGASIGPEMNELFQYMQVHPSTKCFLPESFEWLILKSGLVDGKAVQDILVHPQDFIESQEYFNWERFFTKILIEYTCDTYFCYNKRKLNEAYLHEKAIRKILDAMEKIEWTAMQPAARQDRH